MRRQMSSPRRLRSDGGARHWALAMTLIQTAKLNGVDPMAWLTDVLERVVSGRTKAHELHTLLPCVHGGDKAGHRIVGAVLTRAVQNPSTV